MIFLLLANDFLRFMNKLFFIGIFILPIISSAQEAQSSNNYWLIHFEALGNGGHYSISGELSTTHNKFQGGDRFGFSYYAGLESIRIDGLITTVDYFSLLYEKNFTFGHSTVRPELGIGGTFFILKDPTRTIRSNNVYELNGNRFVFWAIPRVGIRVNVKPKFFVRLGYTPAIFLTELDESNSSHFEHRFGIGIGYSFESMKQ